MAKQLKAALTKANAKAVAKQSLTLTLDYVRPSKANTYSVYQVRGSFQTLYAPISFQSPTLTATIRED